MIRVAEEAISAQLAADSLKTDASGSVVTHTAIPRSSEGARKLAFME